MTARFQELFFIVAIVGSATAACADDRTGLSSQAGSADGLPAEVVELIWSKIDADQDRQGTDREASAAIRPLRVLINGRVATELRDQIRDLANTDDNPVVTEQEAIRLVAKVRGERCPTAARAKEFFARLDADDNERIESGEIAAALKPLGEVGQFLAGRLSPKFKAMDLDRSKTIDIDEACYSANSLLRFQLATEGAQVARHDPQNWFRTLNAVAYLDMDADNRVSPREAGSVAGVAAAFKHIDTNKDEHISLIELCTYKVLLDLSATSGG